MAQNFSRINWDDYKGWDIPVYIHRLNAIPLDKTAYYYSYEEALSYVQDENNVCYPGQLITVIDEENSKITIYKTNLDRTLSEITEGNSGSVAENVYTKEEVDAKVASGEFAKDWDVAYTSSPLGLGWLGKQDHKAELCYADEWHYDENGNPVKNS